jgi:TonB family protein
MTHIRAVLVLRRPRPGSSPPLPLSFGAIALLTSIVATGVLAGVYPAGAQAVPPASSSVLQGAVVTDGGVPIAGAQVLLLGRSDAPAVTPEDGTFHLAAPTGPAHLLVRRVGFRPETTAVVVAEGVPQLTVRLSPAPWQLAPVVVHGGPTVITGPFADFYRRRQLGMGTFITRQDLARRNPTRLADVLRDVPGLRVSETFGRQPGVVMRGSLCAPLAWLDGVPLYAGLPDLDALTPTSIEGIEIYKGVATVPAELMGPMGAGSCGVLAIWTRQGERRPRKPRKPEALIRELEAGTLFTAAQVDDAAALPEGAELAPQYPDSLRRAGVDGLALLEFVVDANGAVEPGSASVAAASHPAFGIAAREALVGIRFTPATRAGRRVRQLIYLPVRFEQPRPGTP